MRKFAGTTLALVLGFVIVFTVMTQARPLADDRTLVGEVIDVGCNTKSLKAGGQGTSAENHADCSYLCISKGMPAGIKTADGSVYWVVGTYTKLDNKALLPFVNKQVKVSGPVKTVDGHHTIAVKSIELLKTKQPS